MEQFVSNSTWQVIEKTFFKNKKRGRPIKHSFKSIFEGILYILKTGCQWRFLPECYPPWQTVYRYFRNKVLQDKFDLILDRVRRLCRKTDGKDYRSRVVIIDSQSVKTTKMAYTRGYDGNKKVKGHKRHILVDSLGLLISTVVTRANVHDIWGGKMLVHQIQDVAALDRVRLIISDKSYQSLDKEGIPTEITTNLTSGFSPLPHRWKVEGSIAWLASYWRLSIDYEGNVFILKYGLNLPE